MPPSYVPVRQDVRKMRYIEWLTTPPQHREPRNESLLAKELDIYPRTLYNWKQDREFREVWRDESDEVIGGEDKRQRIMETLYMAAIDYRSPRHVSAAKLYLEAIGAMRPASMPFAEPTKALGMLSDDELEKLIARGVADMQGEADGAQASGNGLPAPHDAS